MSCNSYIQDAINVRVASL